MKRRVVVTGMGIMSPLGNDLASNWDAAINGRSGIGPITHFDASAMATHFAGEIRDFDPKAWFNAKEVKKMDIFIHYGLAASFMAMQDAGLEITEANAERAGVMIGSGIGIAYCPPLFWNIFSIAPESIRLPIANSPKSSIAASTVGDNRGSP